MEAETRTLTELFQLDVHYVIPLYQRPYVWTKEKQWEPFWEDISTVAEHVYEDGASSGSPSHFLGAIVIQQEESAPGAPPRYLVIDGQQRLTTLQLLLNAAAHCADDLNCDVQAKLIRKLVYNDEDLTEGSERFKVWPTNANQSAFQVAMDPEGDPKGAEDDPGNQIQEAHTYFREQIHDWATEEGSTEERLKAFRDTAAGLLKLVDIRLGDSDNPQVIFETLNARGTPLIALDLLKNSVFLRARKESANSDLLYKDHWLPELDQEHWREERRQGRLFTKNGDLFLNQWLIVELAKPVPVTELFKTFQTQVLDRQQCPPMEKLIPRLCEDAAIVRSFDHMGDGSPEKRFFDRLELLETTTMLSVALLLFRDPEVAEDQRLSVLATLEDFLIRRMICGSTTKNYNRLAADLVGALKERLPEADTAAKEFLARQESPANRWPSDTEVREAITGKALYGFRRQERLVMVLWEVEMRWRAQDSKTEQGLARPDDLTLEHIVPQKWEAHWPLDDTAEDPTGWREEHLHRLGNLTLTSGPLNAGLQNFAWNSPESANDKRRGLVKHSLLHLNSRLAEEHPESFNEHDIDRRGEQLADEIIAIWPGADAGILERGN